jgi:solute carrier family 44 (choline transporter-like protein), member 2/4/5
MAYLLCIPIILFWISASVFIYSIGEPEFQPGSFVANIKWEVYTRVMMWYMLFGLCWGVAFLICF